VIVVDAIVLVATGRRACVLSNLTAQVPFLIDPLTVER
jgi:hypothetical protein